MTVRSVTSIVHVPHHQMSPSFGSYGLRSSSDIALDPFISIDHFRMSAPTFPPHPHAGFSAVTYMLPDSQGAFVNRDSLGDQSLIEPGALHWTQAARGMMHEEVPQQSGTECHGLQIFVNLRSADKHKTPHAFHVASDQVPVFENDGVRVRVLAGEFAAKASPLTSLLTPVSLFDVSLVDGKSVEIPFASSHNVFVLVLGGVAQIGANQVVANSAVGFNRDGDAIVLTGSKGGAHIVVAAGNPISEPLVFGGPFAMNTRAEVVDAQQRFQRGEMGRL
jgi:redox-sensitive bicupin YhaK (pirin superfamily)